MEQKDENDQDRKTQKCSQSTEQEEMKILRNIQSIAPELYRWGHRSYYTNLKVAIQVIT